MKKKMLRGTRAPALQPNSQVLATRPRAQLYLVVTNVVMDVAAIAGAVWAECTIVNVVLAVIVVILLKQLVSPAPSVNLPVPLVKEVSQAVIPWWTAAPSAQLANPGPWCGRVGERERGSGRPGVGV